MSTIRKILAVMVIAALLVSGTALAEEVSDWEDRKDYQHFEIPTDVIAEWYPENQ